MTVSPTASHALECDGRVVDPVGIDRLCLFFRGAVNPLQPPLTMLGVSPGNKRERQQNHSTAYG